VQIWALDQHSAPRLWYGDQTIRVYDAKDLFEESGQWFVRDPAENLGDASTGGVPRRVTLAGRPVLLFELTDRGLVERSVISELHRISITRLYDAYFSRAPDRDVLQHWIAQHNAGMSLAAISDAIARSPGFQAAYGTLTNEQFVTLMYRNVLGRDPDLGGFAAWVSRLDRRALTRGEVMLEFLKSGEYRSRSGATSR
jgi:hypothetical protein